MEDTIAQQWGGFGAIFVIVVSALAFEYRRVRLKLDEVQAARVADAREVTNATREATKEFAAMINDNDGHTRDVLLKIEATLERVDERLQQIEQQQHPRRRS